MKKLFCMILYMAIVIMMFSACGKEPTSVTTDTSSTTESYEVNSEEQESPVTKVNYEEGTYTLMIYMCGSNLETKVGAATKNIAEMLSVQMPEKTKVIIQTGGANKWRNYDISADSSSRYEIKDGELILIEQNPAVNMGMDSSLESFLSWGEENYPAERRGVILWNHGGGSMKGVCYDEQFNNDPLSLPEMKTVFQELFEQTGRKYDFVGFDACLMATYDMACILEPYAEYMIASQELEPSSGWDYKTLISSLNKESFYADVLDGYAKKQEKNDTYTLSVISLSQMEQVHRVIRDMTEEIHENLHYVGDALGISIEFGTKSFHNQGTGIFDLGLFAENMGVNHDFTDLIRNVNGDAHANATGISLYFPTEQEELLEEYKSVCQNESYEHFLVEYFNYQPEEIIMFENPGYIKNGELAFTIMPSAVAYIQTVGYELHGYVGDEETELYCVGTDNDIIIEEGGYAVDFQGNWIYLDEYILHTDIYENNEFHTIFSSLIKVEGELANLLFTYYKPTQTVTVEGYVLIEDTASRVHDLVNGMEVSIMYKDASHEGEPVYNEEGVVTWSDDVNFSIRKIEKGYYRCTPFVEDIYGDVHHGSTAVIYFDGTKANIEHLTEE